MRKIKRYGWRRSLPRRGYAPFRLQLESLPPAADLRTSGFMPPVFDQGDEGSCVANSGCGVMQYDRAKQSKPNLTLSRNFLYYNARVLGGDADTDGGAEIADAITSLKSQGVCSETTWPYTDTDMLTKPPDAAYAEATGYEALVTEQVPADMVAIKTALASGIPVWFGFTVYDSFESPAVAASGVLNLPGDTEQIVGGHAVAAVGYDDASQRVIVRNSWGVNWGQQGYFTMPYAYISDETLASDRWAVYSVT